ncbi:hypothetical protein OS493_038010 [Desmophyllum pertusum]|uniref:Uncharacterized protein n=1 Tax=Desmophyllum pertusum TaxID=174260 RepID=A0A9W9Y8J2_9CNID|nr:hypothetical protein OS493_038010 [Desmophyllum pertusum]
MSKRIVKPPILADSEYLLVQFIEDMEYSIIPPSKLQGSNGIYTAPYGPHNTFYPCIIQSKSENKESLSKMLKNLDTIYKGQQAGKDKKTSKQDRDKEAEKQNQMGEQKRKRNGDKQENCGRKKKNTATAR